MNVITKIDKNTGKTYIPFYDLHGLNTKKAHEEVKKVITECFKLKINSINFVTGKGNHPNVNGERGVLFKKFREWLKDAEIKKLIKNYIVGDGSYKVYLRKVEKTDVENESTVRKKELNLLLLTRKEKSNYTVFEAAVGEEKNYNKSFKRILNACNKYIEYIKKTGVGCNIKSLYWVYKCAKNNNYAEAQFFLGNLYFSVDREAALKWYKISAENGQANSQYILGKSYEFGLLGLEKNEIKSLKWYIKSAKQGHSLAKLKLIGKNLAVPDSS